jgi:hypothetical protein
LGTDIYWFVERYDSDDERWHVIDGRFPSLAENISPIVFVGRDYDLFGLLAGVRGRTKPLFAPRGLPDDVNIIIRAVFEEGREDYVAPSWLTLAELEKVSDAAPIIGGTARAIREHGHGEPIRVIFWFDG